MTWQQKHDRSDELPRYDALSDRAFRLNENAMTWCARNETDGLVPKPRARRLVPGQVKDEHIDELLEVGLWVDVGEAYELPDFLGVHGNKTHAWWEEHREKERTRKRPRDDGIPAGSATSSARKDGGIPADGDAPSANLPAPRARVVPSPAQPRPSGPVLKAPKGYEPARATESQILEDKRAEGRRRRTREPDRGPEPLGAIGATVMAELGARAAIAANGTHA